MSTLFIYLYIYYISVGGQEFVQVDLLDSLHLHNSTYQGVKVGNGVRTSLSPGVVFSGNKLNNDFSSFMNVMTMRKKLSVIFIIIQQGISET